MTREQRLLARLEKHEQAVIDANYRLTEAQMGFLIELGWSQVAVDTWGPPNGGSTRTLIEAVEFARLAALRP